MPVTFKISDTEHVLSSYIFKANSILFEFTFGLLLYNIKWRVKRAK